MLPATGAGVAFALSVATRSRVALLFCVRFEYGCRVALAAPGGAWG